MSKNPRPSVFGNLNTPASTEETQQADSGEVKQATTTAKGETELFRTSLYLPKAAHDKLQEIAFHEGRKKVHDLFIEGIDTVLTKRGYATTSELKSSVKAS